MTLDEAIKELTAEDGPNIPLRTLAIYCGTTHPTLSRYARYRKGMSKRLKQQVIKGLKEYAMAVNEIVNNLEEPENEEE